MPHLHLHFFFARIAGIYIQLFLGPAEDQGARAFQYVGLAASLASLVKGCSDWWVRQAKGMKEPTLMETVKASLFFLPHMLFRLAGLTFCAAFMGYYILIPVCFVLAVNIVNFLHLFCQHPSDNLFATLALTFVAPIATDSEEKSNRILMKRTITLATSVLLITLTIIRLVPEFVPPKDLVSAFGLCHLNFRSLPGVLCIFYKQPL